MSGTRRRILIAALVAAATGSFAVPASALPVQDGRHRAAAAPRSLLAPLTGRRGPNPRVAYYDRRSHRLHDGRRSFGVRFPGALTQLAAVRGGYVLVNTVSDLEASTTLRFVNRHGSRVLGQGQAAYLTAVSADGSSIAYSTDGAQRTTVVRVADGGAVSRRFTGGGDVVALDRVRALVDAGGRTVWWATRTGRVAPYADDEAYAAHLSARRVALLRDHSSLTSVASIPPGSLPEWRLPDTERVARFSGTGRRVLTLGHQHRRPTRNYTLVRLRSTRTGDVRRTFLGRLDPVQDPRWEDARTFLALVKARHRSTGTVREAWLRCTVRGRCERASRVFTLDTVTGEQSPLVLALQHTG